ncbi:MAG TPA: hypothetical protein VIU93_06360 [Gallionellaceae bacterium]
MRDRKTVVLELINKPALAGVLAQELLQSGMESANHLAEVTKMDVLCVLKQLEQGVLSADEIESWARSLHGCVDVGYEFGDDGVVEEAMFWLANPALNWPIDSQLHQRIVALFERRTVKRK